MQEHKLVRLSSAGSIHSPAGGLLLSLILALLIVLPGCGGTAPPPTSTPAPTAAPMFVRAPAPPPYWPTKEWRTSTPEEQGVDSQQLLAMLEHIGKANINIRSITIIRNGYIVLEAFQQPWTVDMQYQVHSVTKSVTGALTGIAIDEGLIKDIKQPVLSFFPELTIAKRDADKDAITIADLLSMQPGLDCADDTLNGAMEQSKNWVQFALDLPMATAPGKKLVYCTAGPHILSAILGKATGMSTAAYAQERLFDPMGIKPDDMSWGADPQSVTLGGYGITMKTHDMAKLGLLYLYGGQWAGRQLVPAQWVAASSKAQASGSGGKDYGYLFWVYPDHFAAEGYGEQEIQVVPDRNMTVVITAAIDHHKVQPTLDLLSDYIIPAAAANSPLPANPPAVAALHKRVSYMANPAQPVLPLPEITGQVSGRTYMMQDNPAGWKTVTLSFAAGQPVMEATIEALNGSETVAQTAAVGLDNVYRVSKSADGSFMAWRGSWSGDHTLVIHQVQSSPNVQESEVRVEFSDDEIKMSVQETIFGDYAYSMQGKAK